MKRWFGWLAFCLVLPLCLASTSCANREDKGSSGKTPVLGGSVNGDVFVAENGLEYTLDASGESYCVSGIGACTETTPSIATSVNGLPVTAIGDYAFFGAEITHVSVPDGITSVGTRAFAQCDSVLSITLPDSVTSVGAEAFYKCTSLESLHLGEGLTAVESYAIAGCSALQSLRIPDSVVSVSPHAFDGSACVKLEGGVYYVDRWVVLCDVSTTEATLRADTVGIADLAFFACGHLQSLTLSESVRSIGTSAFDGCDSILETAGGVSYVSGWVVDCDPNVTEVVLQADTVGISRSAFADCKGLTSLTVNGTLSLGERAFYDFDKLESLTIGEGVTAIGDLAFASCDALLEVHIPSSVTSIGLAAFSGGSSLRALTVDDANPVYHSDGNCVIETASKTLIAGCNTSVIPADGSVTGIGACAFYVSMNLTEIDVPDSVEWIGQDAFYACVSLESITLGTGLKRIEDRAFLRCDALATVYYGAGELSWNQIEISEQDDGNAPLLNATRQDLADEQP
ncbi:MAG: leucine-rich repeat domain-containing protein [Clostridia bacterium]|nr:leucine-rich repeat domain-containing protein [Clostridia bacterium]